MTNIIRLATCLLLALPLAAHGADWRLAPAASELGFSAEAQGEHFDARFRQFTAAIRFDSAQPSASLFEVEINLDSVDSQNSERDEMLADGEFFDVDSASTANWRASHVELLLDGRFRADGELTLRGVTRAVPLFFRWHREPNGHARLEGEAVVDRSAFGVGSGDWADTDLIANEVQVRTTLSLLPVEATPTE